MGVEKWEARLKIYFQRHLIVRRQGIDARPFFSTGDKSLLIRPESIAFGCPSIRTKALSRHSRPVRCVSIACLSRGFEDQSSGRFTLHHQTVG
jgi:hypothetical protein